MLVAALGWTLFAGVALVATAKPVRWLGERIYHAGLMLKDIILPGGSAWDISPEDGKELVKWGATGLGMAMFVGGAVVSLGGGGPSAKGIPTPPVSNAPSTPTIDAVILSDTSASLTTGAFSGEGSHESTIFEVVPIDSPWTAANGIFDTLTTGDLTLDTVFDLNGEVTWKARATHTNSAGASDPSDSLPIATDMAFFSDWSSVGEAPHDTLQPDTTSGAITDSSKWTLYTVGKMPMASGVVSTDGLGFPASMLNTFRTGVGGHRDMFAELGDSSTFGNSKVLTSGTAPLGFDVDTMSVGETLFRRLYIKGHVFVDYGLSAGGPHFYQGTDTDEQYGGSCAFRWEYKFVPGADSTWSLSYHAGGSAALKSWGVLGPSAPYSDGYMDSVYLVETAYIKRADHQWAMRLRIDGVDISADVGIDTFPYLEAGNNCINSAFIGFNGAGGTWVLDSAASAPYPYGKEIPVDSGGPRSDEDWFYWGGFAVAIRPDSTAWIGPYGPGGQD